MLTAILLMIAPAVVEPMSHEAELAKAELTWRSCANREAKRLATKSREPAETIATAALALCQGDARAMELARRRVVVGGGLGTDFSDRINDNIISAERGRLLATVIDAR